MINLGTLDLLFLADVRLTQPQMGLEAALGVGWAVFIPMLAPLLHDFWGPKHPEVPR